MASRSYLVAIRLKSLRLQNAFSILCRSLYAFLLKLKGFFRLHLFGITGFVPRFFSDLRNSALSYALSARSFLAGLVVSINGSAAGQSCASPPVRVRERRRPLASAIAWIFVLRPPRDRPIA